MNLDDRAARARDALRAHVEPGLDVSEAQRALRERGVRHGADPRVAAGAGRAAGRRGARARPAGCCRVLDPQGQRAPARPHPVHDHHEGEGRCPLSMVGRR